MVMMEGKRQSKKRDLEFFDSTHQVRADGRAKGPPPKTSATNDLTVRVFKQTPTDSIGVRLKDVDLVGTSSSVVEVSHIEPGGLFADSKLRVGMEVHEVNGLRCKSAQHGHAFLSYASKSITVDAKHGRNMFQIEDGTVQCTATENGLEVEQVKPPSTPPQAEKKSRKRKLTPFRRFMKRGNGKKPACVEQGRVHFAKTPKDRKRQNDFKHTIHHGLDRLTEGLLPAKSPKSRKAMAKGIVLEYFDKEREMDRPSLGIVSELCEVIQDKKPKERRPIMALISNHCKNRKQGAKLVGCGHISEREWREARLHAKFPGPLEPVEPIKITRCSFNVDALSKWLRLVDEAWSQQHAFGSKNVKYRTGIITHIDAISTTASAGHIIKDYNVAYNSGARLPLENRCKTRSKASGFHCLLPDGHIGRHDFTPKDMISPSSIKGILSHTTKGHMKSKAGLDDEDRNKGSASIERVEEIYLVLASALDHSKEFQANMRKRIKWILEYHRTGFITHLSKNEKKSCQCISCGLHQDTEPIQCHFHETSSHEGPCWDCEESFQVFSELLAVAETAQKLPHLTDKTREPYKELEADLWECRTNLIHWRAHIVRKVVETDFSRKQMRNLGKDEAIVVSDFKMKILPLYFRETKRQFFGKRGTACLGFMVLTNAEEKVGEVDAHFFFFFSDDTTQDSYFVTAGKHYIYTEVLPKLFPDDVKIKVFFETDGAGAFNSNPAKGLMPWWQVWTNGRVDEVQIRHSVNGDGKSPLDGAFGKLGQNFRDAVNDGITDIENADTCLKAYQDGAGISGATAAVIQIDRGCSLKTAKNEKRLLTSHRLVLDQSKNLITAYTNSGYGEGIPLDLDGIKEMFSEPPTQPQYSVTAQAETVKSMESALHSTESHQSRTKRTNLFKREKSKQALEYSHTAKIEAAQKKGVYFCPQKRHCDQAQCRYKAVSKPAYENHLRLGNHHYPSMNLADKALSLVADAEKGMLAVGTRSNRSEEYAQFDVKPGTGVGMVEGNDWVERGCYGKPAPAKKTRMNLELKKHLTRMYLEGEKDGKGSMGGKNKYTPQRAEAELRTMKQHNGLLMFSRSSKYGKLPSVDMIRSFWSRYRRSKKEEMEGLDAAKLDEWIDATLQENEGTLVDDGDDDDDDDDDGMGSARRGILRGLVFVLDGIFSDVEGGSESVKAEIQNNGGMVKMRLSKNTSSNPKKKLDGYPDCSVTNWGNLQQVVSGELALEDLPSTSPSIVSSQNQDSQPIQNKMPAEETNSIDEVSVDFGVADSLNSEVITTSSKKATRAKGRLIKGAKSKARSILSATKSPLKKKARNLKKPSQVFVVDGKFPHIETGDKFIKAEIEKDGGKVMKSLSKNVNYLIAGERSKKAKRVREQIDNYKHITVIEIDENESLMLKQGDKTLKDLISQSATVIPNVEAKECEESGGIEVAPIRLFEE